MSVDVWTSTAFHDEVLAWVDDALAPHGLHATGGWQQPHARTWSSAISIETTGGRVWFKVNGAGTHQEPGLLRVLAERVPDLLPEVLAVDLDRGWSLCRDGGPMLRDVLPADEAWGPWADVLVRYAQAQIELVGARDDVLAAGVAEVSPRTLPRLVRDLVAGLAARPVDEGGLPAEDSRSLEAALPAFDGWCAELAASEVPDSVQHDDLHSGNVCLPPQGPARIIDWGDTTWGCPLATMVGTMNSLAFHAGLFVEGRQVGAPPVLRARDAYLEPFTVYAGRSTLLRLLGLARRTGCVTKALSWRAALRDAPVGLHAEHDFPVRTWLLELLDPPR